MFPNLTELINPNSKMPALDSYIVYGHRQGITLEMVAAIERGILLIRKRLFYAGFFEYEQEVIGKHEIIETIDKFLNFSSLKIEKIKSPYVENSLIILTKSGNGKLFIHPPYEGYSIMSWDRFYYKLHKGKDVHLINQVPWAQMKVVDIV